MTTESFGELLHRYRLRAGIAQNQLARRSRINVGTVNRLERDQRVPSGREQVLALAGALGLEMAETNRMLHAAGLPAEGFGPAITGNPAIVQLVALLQDETIPPADREALLTLVGQGVAWVARANGKRATW